MSKEIKTKENSGSKQKRREKTMTVKANGSKTS